MPDFQRRVWHTRGMRLTASIAFQAMALLGAAAVCALVSNGMARPERRLAWTRVPPPVALPAPPVAPPPPGPNALPPAPAKAPGPQALKPATNPQPTPAVSFSPAVGQPIREIGGGDAAEAFRTGIPFLDARRSAEYELGHIRGAWNLPVWESTLEERLVEFEAQVNRPPEAALVLYCDGGSCEDSHLLASKLFQMGYRNLLLYREGYPDWASQGRPITKGAAR